MKIQNLTKVPISVWGRQYLDPVYTVLPLATHDLVLPVPKPGPFLSYQANSEAGLTSMVFEQAQAVLNKKRLAGYGWASCAAKPDVGCLMSAVVDVLPPKVVVFGREVRVGLLAEALLLAYQNQDLLGAFAGDLAGRPPGTLTFAPAG